MALPNLTRDQAAERAALLAVDSYKIDLDLTDGNGQPGVIARFHDLKSISDKLDEAFKQQARQHSQNRGLLIAVLAEVLVNFLANHWAGILAPLK